MNHDPAPLLKLGLSLMSMLSFTGLRFTTVAHAGATIRAQAKRLKERRLVFRDMVHLIGRLP
jgi:hypothetical protein